MRILADCAELHLSESGKVFLRIRWRTPENTMQRIVIRPRRTEKPSISYVEARDTVTIKRETREKS